MPENIATLLYQYNLRKSDERIARGKMEGTILIL
jgi:hypothetical protein